MNVNDSLIESGETYLLMEQCSGGTLYDKIQAHKADKKPFSEKEVTVWLTKICMALEHLHTDGITHRLLISQVGAILKELKVSLKKLNELADSLENVHFGTTVGSLTGGVIGAAGGITSIVGLILAPFTLGASLIVTGVGVGVAVAGGAVSGVSSITNTVSQNNTFKEIKSIITGLEEKTASVDTSIPHLIKGIESLKGVNFQNISKQKSGTGLLKGLGGVSELVRLARFVSVGKSAAQLSKTVRAAGALSGVFAGLFVALDAVSITMDSIETNRIQQAKGKKMSEDEIKLIKSKTTKFVAEVRLTTKIQQDWLDNRCKIIDSVSNILKDQ
ncbi:apolipoprotein L3-like [Clupea harengus]|uniref:Apolipoprotein L3-like n=1 Tax=Clupea harengus TaxID=7950 RepID=A0A8M1KE07_CLUHA|nr:apolipoprotein L3-like [Clupea harengus]